MSRKTISFFYHKWIYGNVHQFHRFQSDFVSFFMSSQSFRCLLNFCPVTKKGKENGKPKSIDDNSDKLQVHSNHNGIVSGSEGGACQKRICYILLLLLLFFFVRWLVSFASQQLLPFIFTNAAHNNTENLLPLSKISQSVLFFLLSVYFGVFSSVLRSFFSCSFFRIVVNSNVRNNLHFTTKTNEQKKKKQKKKIEVK